MQSPSTGELHTPGPIQIRGKKKKLCSKMSQSGLSGSVSQLSEYVISLGEKVMNTPVDPAQDLIPDRGLKSKIKKIKPVADFVAKKMLIHFI
jgi:hypothetical protein